MMDPASLCGGDKGCKGPSDLLTDSGAWGTRDVKDHQAC